MFFKTAKEPLVHVRFAGRSYDIPMSNLDVGSSSDVRQVKRSVAQWLNVPEGNFKDYVVDRHANGNLTVRPEAVFG